MIRCAVECTYDQATFQQNCVWICRFIGSPVPTTEVDYTMLVIDIVCIMVIIAAAYHLLSKNKQRKKK